MCIILKHLVESAAEAGLGGLFDTGRIIKTIHLTLIEFGHTQPPAPLHTDNSTAAGIINNTVKQQISQEMEMPYFWLIYQVDQRIFAVQWEPGLENIVNYYTKQINYTYHSCVKPYCLHLRHPPLALPISN